jgi:glucose-6-phosphate 1-epimerase
MISAIFAVTLLAGVQAFAPTGNFGGRMASRIFQGGPPPGTPANAKPTFDGTWRVPGDHPEEYVLEMESGAKAVIRTHGCNVFTWTTKEGVEIMGKRADAADITKDEKPYAGGNPHCFPQFGPGAILQHGFARGMDFVPEERAKKLSFDRMIFKLVPTDETKAIWDENFEYRVDVTLRENSLEWDVIVINVGTAPYECTLGMHTYLDVSSLSNVVINGPFTGKATIDKVTGATGTASSDELKITAPIDMAFKGCTGPVTITDTGKGTKITVEGKGYSDMVVWNPHGDAAMGYDKFVCVEPVQMDPVTIPVGKFKETKFYQKVSYEML